MHVAEALEQLDQIHEQVTKGEVYAGFPVLSTALVGVLGLLAALVQPWVPGTTDALGFVVYWSGVALLGAILGTATAFTAFFRDEAGYERRRTRRVLAQFLPALLCGAAVTVFVVQRFPEQFSLLPGLWAVFFGLGLISAGPYFPRGIGSVGGWYLGAGLLALWALPLEPVRLGWVVGSTFGGGHLASAWVLHRHQQEKSRG
jgi:hypothetical protein